MKIKQLSNIQTNVNILASYEEVSNLKIEILKNDTENPVIIETNNSEGSIFLYGRTNYVIDHNITSLIFTQIPSLVSIRISFIYGDNQ